MVKELFDFGILRLIDRTDVDLTLVFVAVARLCKVGWYGTRLHDLFSYEYKTTKLSRVCRRTSMVPKLSDGIEKNMARNDYIRPDYRD